MIITNILIIIALYVMCHLVVASLRGYVRYNKVMYSYYIETEKEKKLMYSVKKLMFDSLTYVYASFLTAAVFTGYVIIITN